MKIAGKLILAAALTAFAFAATVADAQAAGPKQGGALTFIYRIVAGHFNPTIASGTPTGIPGTQMFAALLRYDDQWRPQPCLAESWNIADDGLSVQINLRKNAKFHDGTPITSQDVAFSCDSRSMRSPMRFPQWLMPERSCGSACWRNASPVKYWKYGS